MSDPRIIAPSIITPAEANLNTLLSMKLDPVAVELGNMGVGVIILAAIPLRSVAHIAFTSDRFTLENDITRMTNYYRDNAARLQLDAIKRKLGGGH